uniref:Uncharacterized protein n=1 Tax=Cucumis melo TaxID=3656 RepID=A0A9I9E940_CUCME
MNLNVATIHGMIVKASYYDNLRLTIGKTSNDEELNKLKLDNISSMPNWNDFIKHKTNTTFKAKSKKFKDMKQKQLPHTCSRRGYARLAEDLKNSSSSTSIIRVDVWTKARVKKDGTPINSQVADTLRKRQQWLEVDFDGERVSQRMRGFLRAFGELLQMTPRAFSRERESRDLRRLERLRERGKVVLSRIGERLPERDCVSQSI